MSNVVAVTIEPDGCISTIRYPNGQVMTFGPDGQQIGELQGRYEEVKEECLKRCDKFYHGNWQQRTVKKIPKSEW